QILDLLKNLQEETNTAVVLITHDLGVVANSASRVAVMYGGKIVETGTVDEIFYKAKHPYTWGLLGSMPKLHEENETFQSIPVTQQDLQDRTNGCPFTAHCPYAMKVCEDNMQDYTQINAKDNAACWLQNEREPKLDPPENVLAGGTQ